jgi:hypothetical protein
LETRPIRASRTRWLYFIPLVVLLLGLVFMALANARPDLPGGPDTGGEFFWTGALVLFGAAILGGIIALGLYLWRARAARTLQ